MSAILFRIHELIAVQFAPFPLYIEGRVRFSLVVVVLLSCFQLPTPATAGTWTKVANDGPSPRAGAKMAFDSARKMVVLFGGGEFTGARYGDTWEWDGCEWTQRASGGPEARLSHAMAYDPISRQTILFGGNAINNAYNLADTWSWDGSQWTQLNVTGPVRRCCHSMTYDSVYQRVLLYGGANAGTGYRDTWEWDTDHWALLGSSGPAGTYGAAMAVAPFSRNVMLFGGATIHGCGAQRFDQLWTWNGTAWTLTDIVGPPARRGHAMAGGSVITLLFGGDGPNCSYYADTWLFNGASWSQFQGTSPEARSWAAMAFDSVRNRVVLFGGFDGTSHLGDTWEFDLSSPIMIDSSQTATALPVTGDLEFQFAMLNSGPPPFDPDTWLNVYGHSDLHVPAAFVCNDVPDPLNEPYVSADTFLDGSDEITMNNCQSAFYRFAFQMPSSFHSASLRGTANADDMGVVFLNGYRISPEIMLADLGQDRVDSDGRSVLTWPTLDDFGTCESHYFLEGENELVFGIMGDASELEPTGLEFASFVSYSVLGDLNGDNRVDLDDFAIFATCFGGPNNPPPGSCLQSVDGDLDDDNDVDLLDFAVLQANFTGP